TLHVAVGGRSAGSGTPGQFPERHGPLRFREDIEKTGGDGNRLYRGGALRPAILRFDEFLRLHDRSPGLIWKARKWQTGRSSQPLSKMKTAGFNRLDLPHGWIEQG